MWILSARCANTCAGAHNARAHTGAKISTAHPFYWGCGWFHRIGTGPGGGGVGGRPLRNRGGGRRELCGPPVGGVRPGTFNQKQPGNKRQTTRKQAKNNRPTRPTPEGGPAGRPQRRASFERKRGDLSASAPKWGNTSTRTVEADRHKDRRRRGAVPAAANLHARNGTGTGEQAATPTGSGRQRLRPSAVGGGVHRQQGTGPTYARAHFTGQKRQRPRGFEFPENPHERKNYGACEKFALWGLDTPPPPLKKHPRGGGNERTAPARREHLRGNGNRPTCQAGAAAKLPAYVRA